MEVTNKCGDSPPTNYFALNIDSLNDDSCRLVEKLLQNADIHERDIVNLKRAGLNTIESVAHSTKKSLCVITGISEQKADLLLCESMKSCQIGFVNALDIQLERRELVKITTGSKALDCMLDGGVESGSITEIIGESGAGKTQFCLTLAVSCQLNFELGGAEAKTVYIDADGSFRPERLVEIARRYNIDKHEAMANIMVARCHNTEHQIELLRQAAAIMSEHTFGLIIVDSATGQYRTEFCGRAELALRQQYLARSLRILKRLADVYGVAVVITNQMVDVVDSCASVEGDSIIRRMPIGGNIIAHASTHRLKLTKGTDKRRVCKIYSSPCLPDSEAMFCITGAGISDASATNVINQQVV